RVEESFREAAASAGARASAARLLVTGPGVFSARSRAMIERDVVRLTSLSALIVVTVLLLVYRSPLALGLGFVPVISGGLAGIAAVSLGFGTVHGITLGFGTTLIGEAVDYSIYFLVQAEHGSQAGDRAWLDRFWPTIRIGVLTSIAGFSALLFSGLPGLMQLGLYSITGLIAAAAVTRFVLPALLPSRFRVRDLSALGRRLAAIAAGMVRLRAVVLVLALAAAFALFAKRDTLWDPQLSSLNPIAETDRALDAELRAAIGASDARQMIAVNGPTADSALEAAERIGRELEALVAAGKIGGYESPARFLPSPTTQRARLASLPEPGELRSRLRAALASLPLRPEKLEPFVADVERARSQGPMTREALAGTALESALDGLLFRDSSGRWAALIGVRPPAENLSAGIDRSAVARSIAASEVHGAVLLDLKEEVDRLYSGYFERALLMSAVGLVAIVALLLGALKSARRLIRVMAPLVVGVLVVGAAHAVCGTRMSLLHLVGLLLVVAIGSNYALFFERLAFLRDGSSARTLASLALANFTTVASFGILALSSIPVLRAIGSTVAAGALLVLLLCAILSGDGRPDSPAWTRSGH
ncbi:MAG TPA: MMPL family transporter, partial [Usitatibacter sp.]|nr:MMPL family transporter [Usitatibacter sp.]